MESLPNLEDVLATIRTHFDYNSLVRVQLESYDRFMFEQLPEMVTEKKRFAVPCTKQNTLHVIDIDNMTLTRPIHREVDGYITHITPSIARERSLNYASSVMFDVLHRIYKRDQKTPEYVEDDETTFGILQDSVMHREVLFCDLPVMVGSKLCYTSNGNYDDMYNTECEYGFGGYFIINGNAKTILCQEKMRNNFPMVTLDKKVPHTVYKCELRSWNECKIRSTSTLNVYLQIEKGDDIPHITLVLPFLKYNVTLSCMFRMLGVNNVNDMKNYINEKHNPTLEYLTQNVLRDDEMDTTMEDMLEIIAQKSQTKGATKEKRANAVMHIVYNEFLPHIGLERDQETQHRKAVYLGYIIRKMLRVYSGQIPPDDRDHYANKRLETPGMLMALLFRQQYRNFLKNIQTKFGKSVESGKHITVTDFITPKKITSAFKFAMATGKWGVQKNGNCQTGVAQMLTKTQPSSMISHLRRINMPINREGKSPKPRQLHRTHWGIICVCETPEGKTCGLLKNLGILTHVRIGFPSVILEQLVENSGYLIQHKDCSSNDYMEGTKVFVNGSYIGLTHQSKLLYDQLCMYRQTQDIPFDTTLTMLNNEIWVSTDAGACSRPVFVLSQIHKFDKVFKQYAHTRYLWDQLLYNGIIQYLDKDEEEMYRVASELSKISENQNMDDPYTHCEMVPFVILGILSSLIPLPEHNQAPRNIYQTSMAKAAIGVPGSNFLDNWDCKFHVLDYPQKPMVTTFASDALDMDELPSGQNPIVAIACMTGFNQEDGVILNQSAIDRGMFRSTCYQTYKDVEKKTGTDRGQFKVPDTVTCVRKKADYSRLDQNTGIAPVGTIFEPNQSYENNCVLIGKVMTTTALDRKSRQDTVEYDQSTIVNIVERTIVDRVMVTPAPTKDEAKMIKVRTRASRIPEIGDKFCMTADHDVMTINRGWVPISKVTLDDTIVCLNNIGGVVFNKPKKLFKFHCHPNEELIQVNHPSVSLLVTGNHKMFVKDTNSQHFKYVNALNAMDDTYIYSNYCVVSQHKTNMEEKHIDAIVPELFPTEYLNKQTDKDACNKNLLFLYGHRLFNQSWDNKEQWTTGYYNVNDTLRELGISFDEYVSIYSNVNFPEYLIYLSQEYIFSFMMGATFFWKNSIVVNKELADKLQFCALFSGWNCILKPTGDMYKVIYHYWDKEQLYPTVLKENYSVIPVSSLKDKNWFDNHVYCLQVPTHTFMVRRNGIPIWTGNSSRHGQKGVCGMVLSEENMPFTEQGIKPDMIINPNCIPSRMTLAHLIETLLGKTASISGQRGDGTAFQTKDVIHEVSKVLHELGYEKTGYEVMYDGMTGEKMDGLIFIGPVFYQRLKHIAIDKLHARGRGRVQVLNRQPAQGRSKDGGFRMGNMEVDVLVAHGGASVASDRLLEQSDKFVAYVCRQCGMIGEHMFQPLKKYDTVVHTENVDNGGYCRYCNSSQHVEQVIIPYSLKLVIQELMACMMLPKLELE